MNSRRWLPWLPLFVLGLLLSLSILSSRLHQYRRLNSQNQANACHCKTDQQVASKTKTNPTSNTGKASQNEHHITTKPPESPILAFITNRDNLQVGFNGILMVFTCMLSIVTVRQFRAFKTLQRGIVIIDDLMIINFKPESLLPSDRNTIVSFRFRNIGNTPVRLAEYGVRCCVVTHMVEPPDYGAHTISVVGQIIPKDEHLYRFAEIENVHNSRIPDVTFDMISGSSDVFLVVYGFIRYRDIFRKLHITGFGRQYSALAQLLGDRNQFQPYGGEAYNYTS
jgi:hypothetical protein